MTKTIVFETWMKEPQKTARARRRILAQFDVTELKRRKRAPGRARLRKKKPSRTA